LAGTFGQVKFIEAMVTGVPPVFCTGTVSDVPLMAMEPVLNEQTAVVAVGVGVSVGGGVAVGVAVGVSVGGVVTVAEAVWVDVGGRVRVGVGVAVGPSVAV
jgi:hypothetical protein